MKLSPLLVWCDLAGPLAGEPPMLDGLLLSRAAMLGRGSWHPLNRSTPCPQQGAVPLPLGSSWLGSHLVYHCSNPIMSAPDSDVAEYYHQRFPTEAAELLHPDERTKIPRTMTWTKSYRLPNRVRGIRRICWIAEGNWREIRKLLRDVYHIGKDKGQGYGPIAMIAGEDGSRRPAWGCDERPDLSGCWFFDERSPGDKVLMRNLPIGPWLPDGLVGGMRTWASVSPPYAHPERHCEAVSPC